MLGNPEVPACPSSPQCGRKAPLDCGSEAWPRPGLCPRGGNGTPTPHPGKQLCHPAVPVAAMVSGWDWSPGQRRGYAAGTVHSVVCLCRGWHFSGPPALRAEPHLHHPLGIKVPGFLCRGVFMGGNRPRARLHSSQTDARTLAKPTMRCKHSTCTPEPQLFHLEPCSLGMKLELQQRQRGRCQ